MSQSASLWCSIARCTASTAALPGQPAAQLCKNALHLPPPHPASSHLLAVQRHHPALHHIPRLVTAQRRLHLRIRMSSRRRCCSCANAGGKRALCGCCGLRRRRRLLLVPCCFLFRDQRELQALAAGVGTQHPALDHCRQAGRQGERGPSGLGWWAREWVRGVRGTTPQQAQHAHTGYWLRRQRQPGGRCARQRAGATLAALCRRSPCPAWKHSPGFWPGASPHSETCARPGREAGRRGRRAASRRRGICGAGRGGGVRAAQGRCSSWAARQSRHAPLRCLVHA